MTTSANFLFEMWMLAKQQRTWYAFLWTGTQSIAEHINRVCYVWYVLAKMEGNVDPAKVVMMCLFHDMAESRSLDLNYTSQSYVSVDEARIIEDQVDWLSYWDDIKHIVEEYEKRESQESILAKEADNIELLLFVKEQEDLGNPQATIRLENAIKRVKTEVGKKLVDEILQTKSHDWRLQVAVNVWNKKHDLW